MGTGNKTIRKRRHGTQEIDDMGEGKVTRNRRQAKRKRGREIEYGAEHRDRKGRDTGEKEKGQEEGSREYGAVDVEQACLLYTSPSPRD